MRTFFYTVLKPSTPVLEARAKQDGSFVDTALGIECVAKPRREPSNGRHYRFKILKDGRVTAALAAKGVEKPKDLRTQKDLNDFADALLRV